MEVTVALPASDLLGESPWWSVKNQVLWRTDIQGHKLHSWDPASGAEKSLDIGEAIGCFTECADGIHGICGLQSGIAFVDLETGETTPIMDPEPEFPGNRFNDGKCDRSGRFWAGTMDDPNGGEVGSFYRLDAKGKIEKQFANVITSNGLGWSPDNSVFYYTDSGVKTIWSFSFDAELGTISDRQVFAQDTDYGPDGLTVDAEGFVWSSKWNGSRVVRYAPDGTVDRVIEMPVSRTTSLMFGGPDLKTLYITSARWGLGDSEPLAGHLFQCEPGVGGIAEVPFAGKVPS